MKKTFYIFLIIITGVIGFFSLIKAQAIIQQNPSDVPVKIIDITKTGEKQLFNEYCKDFKLRSATPEAAQSECFNLIQKTTGTTGAGTHSYGEVGKVNDAYYCCFPPHNAIFETPLGTISPTASTPEEKLAITRSQYRCGEGYDYVRGIERDQIITHYNINEGINLSWPKSPLGTSLLEEKDGSPSITIPKLIQYIYEWLISLGGFAAFIALVIAGVQYLTSAGNPGKMAEAISRIRSAGIGLVLLLSSVLILNAINPRLTNLEIITGVPKGGLPTLTIDSVGNSCGTPCLGVAFCSEPNFNGCSEIPVGEGKTVRQNFSMNVKSIKFKPYDIDLVKPIVGDCLVTLFQLEKQRVTDEKPPLQIMSPVKDISDTRGTGFQIQSFEAGDASGAGGFKF